MPTMSYDQFLQYLLSKGIDTVGPAAEALRRQEGIQVDGLPPIPGVQGAPSELPAIPGQQPVYSPPAGGLPTAPQPTAPQPMALQPQAAPAGMTSPLEDFWGQWRNAYTESQQIEKDASGLRRKQFEDASRMLQEQREGPSRQERLLSLSAALLSPTSLPGFKGALGNVAPVMAQMATLKRQSEQGRQKQLYDLQQQYLGSGIEDRRAGVKGRMDLLEMAQKMNKPERNRTGFNPITGELVDMDTGELVTAGNIPTLTVDQVAAMSKDPRNRGKKFRTTDGRTMEIK